MIDLMLSMVAPHICSGCSEYGNVLCKSCMNDIVCEDFGRCLWCLKPVAEMHQCTSCQEKYKTHGAWAVGEREGALKRVLNDYKFESRREAAVTLAELLDATLPSLPSDMIVTWVPTAPAHVRSRGFDHAALLARKLATRRRLEALPLLERHTSESQHELSRAAREQAAKHAFGLRRLPPRPKVLLIDDVLTTGATLRACIDVLRATDAQVYVAIVARQPQ